MVKIIMHGCNGKMGQVISGLIAADPDMELVAGIDARDDGHNPTLYSQIFTNVMAADAIIDFSAAVASCWITAWRKLPACCVPLVCPRHSWRK